jgi:hypothetical protein
MNPRHLAPFALLVGLLAAGVAIAAGDVAPQGRLSGDAVPSHYRLELQIDPDSETFSGSTEIQLTLKSATSLIWLHGLGLKVTAVSVTTGGRKLAAHYEEVDHDFGVARVTTDSPISAGPAVLEFTYNAPFQTTGQGLYRTKRANDWYAYTQFEAIDARRAFPGFDEPGFKTPFDITVRARNGAKVITNTPETRAVPEKDGWVRHEFQTTRPLPTYLLAFAVGPFDIVDAQAVAPNAERHTPLPLRIVGARGQGVRMAYAAREAPKLVQALETYFGTPFPYPKLDLIASPLAGGAMENAGAIIFDDGLLFFGEHPTAHEQSEFGMVTAHEMAHQWFGDLVTPAWWDDIWLNESFAEWMGVKISDQWRPDLGIKADQLTSTLAAMNTDALRAGRPIHQPIDSNAQITSSFDNITYEKGAGVLGMMESYLGEQRFQSGVRLHLQRHAYGTATAADFFAAMAQGSGDAAVVPAFRSFVDQAGVPLVTLNTAQSDRSLALTQSRYRRLGSGGNDAEIWQIPVCVDVIAGASAKSCTLLSGRTGTLTLPAQAHGAVIHPNAQGEGYYRFAVDAATYRGLLGVAAHLPPREALSFADSVSAAFDANRLSFADLLAAAQELSAQPDRNAAVLLGRKLATIDNTLASAAERPALERRIVAIYKPRLTALGYDTANGRYASDPGEQQLLRQALLSLVALDGRDADVTAQLADAAQRSSKDPQALDPLLRRITWAAAVRRLGKPFADQLEPLFFSSNDVHVREDVVYALGRAAGPPVSSQALALLLDQRADLENVAGILFAQSADATTREATWRFLRQNRDSLLARVPTSAQIFLARAGQSMCSSAERQQFDDTLGARLQTANGGKLTLARVRESIDDCIALRAAVGSQLHGALTAP